MRLSTRRSGPAWCAAGGILLASLAFAGCEDSSPFSPTAATARAEPLSSAAAASPTINTTFNNLGGLSATGSATVKCVTTGTKITIHLNGLRPKGVYTGWLFTYMPPGFDGTQVNLDGVGSLGASDGSQNSFKASASGTGQLSVIMPTGDLSVFGNAGSCLPVDEAAGFHFVIFFHTDAMTHGPITGPGFPEGGFIMA